MARRVTRPARAGRWLVPAAVLVGILLAGRALELRLPGMSRPFWEDEIHHNFAVLDARTIGELLENIQAHVQPVLDYALRKEGWLFLLGTHERSWRVPSMIWSLMTLAAGIAIAVRWTRFRGAAPGAALVAAAVAGLWIIHHPVEIHYAAEARHYSFVSFLSLVWFSLAGLPGPRRPWLFAAVSVAFANTHFFGLPLMLGAYGISGAGAARRGQWARAAGSAGVAAAILAFTLALNSPAVHWLSRMPPPAAGESVAARILAGLAMVPDAWRYLALPVPAVVIWLGLVVSRRRRDAAPVLAAGLGLIPLLLVYDRLTSSHAFNTRYYMPFFGLGFATLLLGLDAVRRVVPRRRMWVGPAAAAILVVWQGAGRDAVRIVPDLGALRLPPRDFSPYWRIYEEVKKAPGPLLLIHAHCYAQDIPLMYLRHVGRPYADGYTVIDAMGCAVHPADARRAVERFVAVHPEGTVVLDDKNRGCPDPGPPRGEWGASVRRVRSEPVSVWIVRGAASTGELRRIARAVRFDSLELLWKTP